MDCQVNFRCHSVKSLIGFLVKKKGNFTIQTSQLLIIAKVTKLSRPQKCVKDSSSVVSGGMVCMWWLVVCWEGEITKVKFVWALGPIVVLYSLFRLCGRGNREKRTPDTTWLLLRYSRNRNSLVILVMRSQLTFVSSHPSHRRENETESWNYIYIYIYI